MLRKRNLSLVLAAVLLAGVLSACAPAQNQQPAVSTATAVGGPNQGAAPAATDRQAPDGRGITLAILAETPSVAPARHTATEGTFKNVLTHNGLFRLTYDTLTPVPDLVESWRPITDSVFEFTLRQGIRFHNGMEMTAEDVVASMHYVRTYPIAAPFHASIVGAEFVDRYIFTLDTGEPNAMLFYDLGFQANFIMPAPLIEAGHDFQVSPIGSGPFYFENWSTGDSLTFRRFDDYFDNERSARVDYVHWRIIPEGALRTLSLENEEVDIIVEVSFPDVPRLEQNPNIVVSQIPSTRFSYLLLNNDLPQFENVYARRAIDMALDKEAMLIASLEGFGAPTWQTTPPVFHGSSLEGIRSFDPDGARALLAEHNIDPASLAFVMTTYSEENRRRAEVVQSNLADIGIPTTIIGIDFAAWLDSTRDGTYEAAFGAFTASNMLMFMRSTMHLDAIPAPNRSRIRNQELTDLISQAIATTVDADARIALLEEASRVSNEHVGFIPTNTNVIVRAFNSNLAVPEIAPTGVKGLNMAHWLN